MIYINNNEDIKMSSFRAISETDNYIIQEAYRGRIKSPYNIFICDKYGDILFDEEGAPAFDNVEDAEQYAENLEETLELGNYE